MIFFFKTRMFILWPKKKQFSDDYDISYVSYTLLQKIAIVIVVHNVTLLYEIPWALQPETIVQIRRRSSWKTLRWCILFCSTTFILTFFKNSFLNLKHNHEHILYYWKIFLELWIIFFLLSDFHSVLPLLFLFVGFKSWKVHGRHPLKGWSQVNSVAHF